MIGAIIGDIAGSRFEFHNTSDYDFEIFHKYSSYTDDTVLTIATADTLINRGIGAKAEDFRDYALKWAHKYPCPMGGYGSSFSRFLHDPDHRPYNSFGNGAVMRISPVIFAARNRADAVRLAIESARFSHDHTEALIAAQTLVLSAWEILHNDGKISNDQIADSYTRLHYRMDFTPKKWNETCQYCVPLAIHLFKQSVSFEDAIRLAVCFGGDSDTLAAIVGALAEAAYGVPVDMQEKAMSYLPAEMRKVIINFNELYR